MSAPACRLRRMPATDPIEIVIGVSGGSGASWRAVSSRSRRGLRGTEPAASRGFRGGLRVARNRARLRHSTRRTPSYRPRAARADAAPRDAPRHLRRRRLDRFGLLSRPRDGRRSVQRRHARRDRARDRARPAAARGRRLSEGEAPARARLAGVPYSLVHIENMRLATLAGAIIAPPCPPSTSTTLPSASWTRGACGRPGGSGSPPATISSGEAVAPSGRPRPARRKR